jgi:hypothetical protein
MRQLGAIIAAFCAIGIVAPAHAFGELKFCDDIKDDPQARMVCLQAHITRLEETILRLDAQIAGLEKELQQKLNASAVYKMQSVAQGKCLGFAGAAPAMLSCDRPDSWKLLIGAQSPPKPVKPTAKPDDQATPTPETPDKTPDNEATPKPDKKAAKPDDKATTKSNNQGTPNPDEPDDKATTAPESPGK